MVSYRSWSAVQPCAGLSSSLFLLSLSLCPTSKSSLSASKPSLPPSVKAGLFTLTISSPCFLSLPPTVPPQAQLLPLPPSDAQGLQQVVEREKGQGRQELLQTRMDREAPCHARARWANTEEGKAGATCVATTSCSSAASVQPLALLCTQHRLQ